MNIYKPIIEIKLAWFTFRDKYLTIWKSFRFLQQQQNMNILYDLSRIEVGWRINAANFCKDQGRSSSCLSTDMFCGTLCSVSKGGWVLTFPGFKIKNQFTENNLNQTFTTTQFWEIQYP